MTVRPLEPIFTPRKKLGTVDVGNTPAPTLPLVDSFNRVVASGLGIADTGQLWDQLTAGVTSVDGSNAVFQIKPGSGSYAGVRQTIPNCEGLMRVRFPTLPSDGNASAFVYQLIAANGSRVAVWFRVTRITPTIQYWLVSTGVGGGSFAVQAQGNVAAYVANTWWWWRVRRVNQTLKIRMWRDGDPEPGTWTANVTTTAFPLTCNDLQIGALDDLSTLPSPRFGNMDSIAVYAQSASGLILVEGNYRGIRVGGTVGCAIDNFSCGLIGGAADFSDDFNRANNASLGASWLEGILGYTTNLAVTSNTCRLSVTGQASAQVLSPAAGNDQWAQFTVSAIAGTPDFLCYLRGNATLEFTNQVAFGRSAATGGWRIVSSTGLDVTVAGPGAATAGMVIRGEAEGNDYRLYVNGSLVLSVSEP